MNWMQAYEILSCCVLAIACIAYNLSMRVQWRVTRAGVMLLCVSAIVRGACLVAKYTSLANMAATISAAADANIPLMTALVMGSIIWQRIQTKRKLT